VHSTTVAHTSEVLQVPSMLLAETQLGPPAETAATSRNGSSSSSGGLAAPHCSTLNPLFAAKDSAHSVGLTLSGAGEQDASHVERQAVVQRVVGALFAATRDPESRVCRAAVAALGDLCSKSDDASRTCIAKSTAFFCWSEQVTRAESSNQRHPSKVQGCDGPPPGVPAC
jgi:hypothetical protein